MSAMGWRRLRAFWPEGGGIRNGGFDNERCLSGHCSMLPDLTLDALILKEIVEGEN